MNFGKAGICIFLLLGLVSAFGSTECRQVQADTFFTSINRKIDHETFDAALLENAVVFYSNTARKKHSTPACQSNELLHRTARKHSREMAELGFFSHTSPNGANRTLENRLRNQEVILKNVCIGENLAVDFILDISGRVYYTEKRGSKTVYIDNETGRQIVPQTYRHFAQTVVQQWLESPEHRKNLLNKGFTSMGVGVYRGTYKGLAAVYVTQNFYGRLGPEPVSGVTEQSR